MKSLAALCAYSVSPASGSTMRMPHNAVRNSGALTIESIMRGSVARVTAGGAVGAGLVAARAPPQPESIVIAERHTTLVRVDIDDPRSGGWAEYCCGSRRATRHAVVHSRCVRFRIPHRLRAAPPRAVRADIPPPGSL